MTPQVPHNSYPEVALDALDTLWFQVAGTVCNLECSHCLVSASPTNRTHEMITLEQVRSYLDEAQRLGVKEYYFTGGEPFLNPEMDAIIGATLQQGPVTVLTNGLRLDKARCARLAAMAAAAEYSLDLRISLDGYDAASNDPIRGAGTFDRILASIQRVSAAGIEPVITVTEVCGDASTDLGKRRFFELLQELGIDRPRLKILPIFKIGAEADRGGSYEEWQRLRDGDDGDAGWSHLQCSACRMVTAHGVWVCPILVNEPGGRMGERLEDTLTHFPLSYQACWTCHVQGASCKT